MACCTSKLEVATAISINTNWETQNLKAVVKDHYWNSRQLKTFKIYVKSLTYDIKSFSSPAIFRSFGDTTYKLISSQRVLTIESSWFISITCKIKCYIFRHEFAINCNLLYFSNKIEKGHSPPMARAPRLGSAQTSVGNCTSGAPRTGTTTQMLLIASDDDDDVLRGARRAALWSIGRCYRRPHKYFELRRLICNF